MKALKATDLFFIALSLAFCVASFVFAADNRSSEKTLVVQSPEETYLYSLNTNAEVVIRGVLGDTVIAVQGGAVFFADSPCENKLCISHEPLKRSGEWNVCLPNRVMARIEGRAVEEGVDAVVY